MQDYTKQDVDKAVSDIISKLKKNKNLEHSSKPKLHIVGGQPGAGKSSSIKEIKNDFKENCIEINYDDYRVLHPNAIEIFNRFKDVNNGKNDEYSKLTNPFIKEVGDKIIKFATENNYNVILEKTLNNPKVEKYIENDFKNYELGITIVTTSAENSKKSTLDRFAGTFDKYKRDVADNIKAEPPRYISDEYQEKCFEGLGKATQFLATRFQNRLTSLKIIKRDENYKPTEIINSTRTIDIMDVRDKIDDIVFDRVASKEAHKNDKSKTMNGKNNVQSIKIININNFFEKYSGNKVDNTKKTGKER